MAGIEVILDENEPIDKALKRFKKRVERSGLRAEMKRHEYYEKPSERRKRKLEAARRAQRRRQRALERKMARD
jgi:small subunit ribosomal protein S21